MLVALVKAEPFGYWDVPLMLRIANRLRELTGAQWKQAREEPRTRLDDARKGHGAARGLPQVSRDRNAPQPEVAPDTPKKTVFKSTSAAALGRRLRNWPVDPGAPVLMRYRNEGGVEMDAAVTTIEDFVDMVLVHLGAPKKAERPSSLMRVGGEDADPGLPDFDPL